MPARRSAAARWTIVDDGQQAEQDARLAGNGIDWTDEPVWLPSIALDEWRRLAVTFEHQPTRFREGDRAALEAYCGWYGTWREVLAAMAAPLAPGRSSADTSRLVRNPLSTSLNQASQNLRAWARELGLTPDARGRAGLKDDDEEDTDAGNPFAG